MNTGATPSRRAWLVGTAAASMAAGGVWWAWHARQSASAAQESFWVQHFQDPSGRLLRMLDFKAKPLVLNFWATWCPPCLEELPLLESFFLQNQANSCQILGLAVDQDESVKRFLARSPLSYPVGLAGYAGMELSRSLGNSQGGLPFTVFFDASGRVVHHKIGLLNADDLGSWARAVQAWKAGVAV